MMKNGLLLIGVWLFSTISVVAQSALPIHWGVETWYCGSSLFSAILGDGRDVILYQVYGTISAAPQNGASTADAIQRQALVILEYDRPAAAVTIAATSQSPGNNEDDGALMASNPKTMGPRPWMIPVNVTFTRPPLLLAGNLRLFVDNNAPGPISWNIDCLDVEVHLNFIWNYAAGDGM